ncbi:MAG TPA: hypothetical protein VHE33_09145, partial [Acidobacteriaceae bacterium]|nr:hypothetical protein [Acidobacteriaceae bacterium]
TGRIGQAVLEDRFTDLMELAKLFQFAAEAVPQRALGTQFVQQYLGLDERIGRDLGLYEQLSPATGNFLFGEQVCTFHEIAKTEPTSSF